MAYRAFFAASGTSDISVPGTPTSGLFSTISNVKFMKHESVYNLIIKLILKTVLGFMMTCIKNYSIHYVIFFLGHENASELLKCHLNARRKSLNPKTKRRKFLDIFGFIAFVTWFIFLALMFLQNRVSCRLSMRVHDNLNQWFYQSYQTNLSDKCMTTRLNLCCFLWFEITVHDFSRNRIVTTTRH